MSAWMGWGGNLAWSTRLFSLEPYCLSSNADDYSGGKGGKGRKIRVVEQNNHSKKTFSRRERCFSSTLFIDKSEKSLAPNSWANIFFCAEVWLTQHLLSLWHGKPFKDYSETSANSDENSYLNDVITFFSPTFKRGNLMRCYNCYFLDRKK